jgi:tetratricopeptide (TPR) repeat protein
VENVVHLQNAAHAFLRLNDPLNAVACLEKALAFNEKSGDRAREVELRFQMVQAKRSAGDLHGALQNLNSLMVEHDDHLDVHALLLKSEILSELNQPAQAVACLQEALKRFPDSPELHQFAAQLLRQMGDLPRALEHAEKQISTLRNQDQPLHGDHVIKLVKAITQAAELARFSLQPEQARKLLDEPLDLPQETDQPELYPYFILRAELALEAGEEIKTAQGLTKALAQDENHLRTRALQARLLLRQGDFSSAQKTLNECIHQLSGNRFLSSSVPTQGKQEQPCLDAATCLAVVSAALEAGYWNQAVKLAQQAVRLAPREPLPHLQLAQVMVIRAEAQKLCQELEARHHAPGWEALSEEAYHLFLEAIESASKCQLPQPHPPQIHSLLLRGKALFQNETGLHSRLPDCH